MKIWRGEGLQTCSWWVSGEGLQFWVFFSGKVSGYLSCLGRLVGFNPCGYAFSCGRFVLFWVGLGFFGCLIMILMKMMNLT